MKLWHEIRKDRENGARKLVSEYGNRLFAVALLLCPNSADAEELVFRSLDQAIRRIGEYKPTGDFFNWLYTIMLNFRRMELRKKRISLVLIGHLAELSKVSDEAIRSFPGNMDKNNIRKALDNISPLLREVVVRHYFGNESIAQIAVKLQISEGTVKSRLFNAREVLHELLSEKRK